MTPREFAAAIARGTVAPVYLVIGDDEAGKDEVVASLARLVEEELRGFNVERFTAGDARPDDVVFAARTLPMLGERRVVVFTHIERLFKGRKKLADVDDEEGTDESSPPDPGGLEGYIANPEPPNVLVLVASDVNRSTKLGKALHKLAVTVECDGFNTDGFNGPQAALRDAMQFAADRAKAAGKRLDAPALTALVERAGPDIMRLRKDIDTLVLFVGEASAITEGDVRVVVGAAQQFDDWAVTNAITAGDAAAALRHVQLMVENGSSPFQMLGQLGWWVRTKMAQVAPARVGAAVRALFAADAASKLGRDPQVVLERLVVELCGARSRKRTP
jgi:DNA polymerase-3 subunit delta